MRFCYSPPVSFRRVLTPFDATMVVIGGIIGSGIFINPYIVAQRLPSGPLVLGAWVAGGAIALAGALAYAELGTRAPRAGGQYVYLRDGLHPILGFMYAWALLVSIESGAVAAVALTFAQYTLRLTGGAAGALPLAAGAILLLSVVNGAGVKPGARVLNVFVVLKVAALATLIGAGFLFDQPTQWARSSRPVSDSTVLAFGTALIPILFAYGGWQNANYVAEEIERPQRTLPRSLLAGTTVVVVVYVLVNLVYLRALGLEGLAATMTPAADAAERMFGGIGRQFVTAAIAVSTFGFLDLAILAPTRVYYAVAADGAFPGRIARLHPRWGTPVGAIALQSAWSLVLLFTGSYGELLNTVVFADWIFFGLTVATLFAYRRRQPARADGVYEMMGYPVLPAAFVAVAAAIVLSVVRADPVRAGLGALLLAAGLPVYFWNTRRRGQAPAGLQDGDTRIR
jgi:APA family basic amino acid/polyamine antiporter